MLSIQVLFICSVWLVWVAPPLVALGRDVRDPPGSATSFMPDIARSSLTSAATPHFTSLSYFPPPYKLTGRVAALITRPLIGRHFAECSPRFRTTDIHVDETHFPATNNLEETLSVEIWLFLTGKISWIESLIVFSFIHTNLWHYIFTLNHRYCLIILIDI